MTDEEKQRLLYKLADALKVDLAEFVLQMFDPTLLTLDALKKELGEPDPGGTNWLGWVWAKDTYRVHSSDYGTTVADRSYDPDGQEDFGELMKADVRTLGQLRRALSIIKERMGDV